MASVIWPWAETNQGLLSILALAAALSVAVYENWRANRVEGARRREFVDTVLDLIDELMRDTADLRDLVMKRHQQGEHAIEPVAKWNSKAKSVGRAIATIVPAAPSDAKLILALMALERHLDVTTFMGAPGAGAGDGLAREHMYLKELRAEVAASRDR